MIDFLLTDTGSKINDRCAAVDRQADFNDELRDLPQGFGCGRLLFVSRMARPVTLTTRTGLNTIAGHLIPSLREV
jgi:hypothetical protein